MKSPAAVLVLLAALLVPQAASGAFELRAVEPREVGCGTVLALGPCGLDGDSCARREVAVYGFRPFGVRGIEVAAASCRIGFESRLRRVDLAYQRLSAPAYCEQVWLVSAALAGKNFLIRPAARLALASLDGDLRDWALLADCQGSVAVTRSVWVGACLENPFGQGLTRSGDRAPTTLRASVAVTVADRIAFGIDVSKSNGFATCLASGVEWRPAGGLWLRAGVRTFPRELALGVGVSRAWLTVEVATSINAELGATHEAGVRVRWR